MVASRVGYLAIFIPIVALNVWVLHRWTQPLILILPSLSGLFTMGICFILERTFTFRTDWRRPLRSAWNDLFHTMVLLPIVILFCCYLWKFITFGNGFNHLFSAIWWSVDRPWWIHSISAMLIAEFLFYWFHRLSHSVPLLWKWHEVHHRPIQLDWYNAGRFHLADLFFNFFLYMAPFYLFAVPKQAIVFALSLNVVTGLLEHANIHLRSGILNWLVNTGELHRWHHSIVVSESRMNFGKVLSVWDVVFRSFLHCDVSRLKTIGVERSSLK